MERTVNDMKIGERAVVTGLGCTGALRRRIIDMGITPGATVIMRKAAPMGDPLEINVRGYELSIRRSEAKEIAIISEGVPSEPSPARPSFLRGGRRERPGSSEHRDRSDRREGRPPRD